MQNQLKKKKKQAKNIFYLKSKFAIVVRVIKK